MATRSTLANTVNAVQTDGDGGVRKENDGISGSGALHKVDSQGPGLEHQEQEQQQKKTKSTVVAPKTIESGKALPAQLSIWDNAMILVDKPQTWTSFDVCAKLRGALAATLQVKSRKVKVGHAGTLDPMATGLLIVCVGKGTKSIESFVGMNKEYSGTLRLGESTDSYDADGKIVDGSQEWQHVTGKSLFDCFSLKIKTREIIVMHMKTIADEMLEELRDRHFLGDIEQLPPMFSAIRVGGKRLYEAARKGKEVERQPRKIHVSKFDLERDRESNREVNFLVECSKGTYIRSLAHDLGQAAGCGAHLTKLRRQKIGQYSVDDAWKIEDLVEAIHEQRQLLC